MLVCGWVGHVWVCWGLGLEPSLPSNSKYIFYLSDEGGVRTEPCAPGVALDDLQCPVHPEHVNAWHHLHFEFHICCFHRQQTHEVSIEEVAFWS